jgi:hypothetical protein
VAHEGLPGGRWQAPSHSAGVWNAKQSVNGSTQTRDGAWLACSHAAAVAERVSAELSCQLGARGGGGGGGTKRLPTAGGDHMWKITDLIHKDVYEEKMRCLALVCT